MALTSGTQIGSYEILGAIGAGGMGEVYRARDTKLGRSVAIKSLPPSFVDDPHRVGRFQREAQLLAALNHPHIAAIYDFEEAAGAQFLILELVDGETLAQRLARENGRPLPLDETMRIARQVVDALEAAHEKGIIHRDMKPANIALTANGNVKVLDFGLARLDQPDASSAGDATNSPTLTFAATQAGVILGTAAYMSPEQARGRAVDKRSDVWAFGCVLYEMLTGSRAFHGEDASDTLAAVLRAEPDWRALPAGTPPGVQRLLRRCLAKDPRDRVRDIGDVRLDLDDAVADDAVSSMARAIAATIGSPEAPSTPALAAPRLSRIAPWAVAALLAAVLVAIIVRLAPWRTASPRVPVQLSAEIGADASLDTNFGASAILSPDGGTLAFVAANAEGTNQLYVRRLDRLQATLLAGTDDAESPFFSPDGQWVAFFAGGRLKKSSVNGGAPVTLTDAPFGRGGTWSDDDVIVFQPNVSGSPLMRVSAAGGTPSALTAIEGRELQRWPQALPGGRGLLYSVVTGTSFVDGSVMVQPPQGAARPVIKGGYYGRYVPSGHLVYLQNSTLFAVAFDLDRLETIGQAVPVKEGVASAPNTGGAQFSIADSGTLAFVPGRSVNDEAAISWMDHTGKPAPLRAAAASWSNPAFAPDGQRLAVDVSEGSQTDLWIYEWARDTLSRLTFDPADDVRAVWTPDSRRVAFASRRGDKSAFNLYWQNADGSGEPQRLTESPNNQFPGTFHPSGKFLAFFEQDPQSVSDLLILAIDGDEKAGWTPGKPTVFLKTPFAEQSPMFSPDGRWIAYLSNESGRTEMFVRPFPGPGGKWQVSTGPADDPTWSRSRRELFYASTPDLRIMVAPYTAQGESFRVEKPRLWSEGRFTIRPRPPSRDFDLHPDGDRFAIAAPIAGATTPQVDKVVLVFNFLDELRRMVPRDN